MIEITILSGKGGTGKTSVAAALAGLAKNTIICDNDVDAADMHLILNPKIIEEHKFNSGWNMEVNNSICNECGICVSICRFDAINFSKENKIEINPFKCEACRLCERICPEKAIFSEENRNNSWFVSNTRFGTLVHAHMGPGEENSGKLVTQVRKRAREIAIENKSDFIINDGPPGIGCATIASLTGTDKLIIVMEPSKSSLHDADRLVELAKSFDIDTYAIINKYDINQDISNKIINYLEDKDIPLLTKLPFDKSMVESMINGQSIIEYKSNSEISNKIEKLWKNLTKTAE